ncbi:MAG: hypothetical protein M3Z46_00245 [Actinomycetota bacterium]|nr:hypothetical protein [Actinomycetota bacterium]
MPAAAAAGLTFLGTGSPDAELLIRSLDVDRSETCPPTPLTEGWAWDWTATLDAWRDHVESLPSTEQVVVCTWTEPVAASPLVELDAARWRQQVEWPTALWFTTIVAAAGRCCDGGSVVAVVERPANLDASGQSPAVAVADGVANLVRSLAAHEGGRGVRVNAVVTSRHTDRQALPGAVPPLATFPGRIDVEVAGAVRLLLSPDAVGMTGLALPATCGRR